MTPTEEFIQRLKNLKEGELGLLRSHAYKRLDTSVNGFDLFTGIWWPLREKSQRAPKRDVAWLITKIYASLPIPDSEDTSSRFAHILGILRTKEPLEYERYCTKFDMLLEAPLNGIEAQLSQWLSVISDAVKREHIAGLNWVMLINDLSAWDRESTKVKWAKEFLHQQTETATFSGE